MDTETTQKIGQIVRDTAKELGITQADFVDVALRNLAQDIADWGDDAREDMTSASEAAKALFRVKAQHESLDKSVKVIYHVKDMLDKHLVPTLLEKQGVDMIRVPEIARSFSRQPKLSASFIDKEAGFNWLREIGQEDMIQPTVNAGTLSSFVNRMIRDDGIEPPDDVVRVNTYYATGINKYTPKD